MHQPLSKPTDLEERVSYVQSVTNKDGADGYNDVKTPTDLEGGALAPGGAVKIFSLEAMALFAQYGSIGIILGMIPALNYPVFNVYLQLEGYQTSSYSSLVTIGWSFKAFMGMMSDCFPMFGYRRKPWMLIGWTIAAVCLMIMAFTPLGEPYCNRVKAAARNSTACSRPYSRATPAERDLFNLSAPDNGGLFIILSMFTSIGYVTAVCAADAIMVQYSQREPENIRGRMITAIYAARELCSVISIIAVGFGLSDPNYNGTFSFSMSPNVPYMICLVPCAVAILTTIFVLKEEKTPATPLREYIGSFWGLLQKRVMWQVLGFRFISNVFYGMSSTATGPMASIWVDVEPIFSSVMDVLGTLLFVGVLSVVGKWGLNWNWRWAIAIATVSVIFLDAVSNFLIIWNVVRNQWFYLGSNFAETIPVGVRFIVSSYCAVEIADIGNEGATFGLLSTVSNLTSPLAGVIFKYYNSYFKMSQNDLMEDTDAVRWDVSYSFIISYACKLFALVWLFLLPPQRGPMQELKKKGITSKLAAGIVVFMYFFCLTFSVTTQIMSIFPSTKCYRIAGGNGVLDPATGKCPAAKSRKG